MVIKDTVKKILGGRILGWWDFLRHSPSSWGKPFNGQQFRQRIFFDLLYYFPIKAIVETGTYRGITTAFFGATTLPVYTAEIHPRFFAYARLRFLFNRDVIHLHKQDSRSFLRALSANPLIPKADVFFYLDAHWEADLPLREELEIIFTNWQRPVIMIDDFAVPGSAYAFDDYGPGKTLDLSYIEPVVASHKLAVFFPAVQPAEETGLKRGSVVLCPESLGLEIEANVKTLIRHR